MGKLRVVRMAHGDHAVSVEALESLQLPEPELPRPAARDGHGDAQGSQELAALLEPVLPYAGSGLLDLLGEL
eukprot:scaffold211999_cov48-Prasinocladus_malaysianus.AAC.1